MHGEDGGCLKEVGSVGSAHGDDVTDEMVLALEVLKDVGNVSERNDTLWFLFV